MSTKNNNKIKLYKNMEKPDIFPATMLTNVTDPAAKHSITFTLRDYISYID